MSLDATVSGTSANSYVTLAVAQAYFDDRLNTDPWDSADQDQQEAALQMACARIDEMEFIGRVTSSTQALQWPRAGLVNRNGVVIPSTTIPTTVQDAQCELALALLADAGLSLGGDLDAFEQITLGSMSLTPKAGRTGLLSSTIKRMLAQFLAGGTGIPVFRA